MHTACLTTNGDLPKKQAITKTKTESVPPHVYAERTYDPARTHGNAVLLHGDAALALALNAGLSTVRTWRAKRLIPFIKTGHKSISYNLPKVLAALESLTVHPRGAKKGGQ
jgi:hypothetical protein